MSRIVFKIERARSRGGSASYNALMVVGAARDAFMGLKLGLDDEISIGDRLSGESKRTIVDCLRALLNPEDEQYLPLDTATQVALGSHLAAQLRLDRITREDESWPELRIVTDDPHVANLPWALLTIPRSATFLIQERCSIAVAGHEPRGTHALPSPSRVLLVAPEPPSWEPTDAESHLREVLGSLSSVYSLGDVTWIESALAGNHDYIRCVSTLAEVKRQLGDFRPNVLYYYGHGVLDRGGLKLIFENASGDEDGHPVQELAQFISASPVAADRLKLVYLNCCWGGAGGYRGAAFQLRDYVPALISNRTPVLQGAARSQARRILKAIVVDGLSPHAAVTDVMSDIGARDIWPDYLPSSDQEPWWVAPVVYANYDEWISEPAPVVEDQPLEERQVMRLDREMHWGVVNNALGVSDSRSGLLVCLWCGRREDGVQHFGERLGFELQAYGLENLRYFKGLAWPAITAAARGDDRRLFEHVLLAALNENGQAQHLRELPTVFRNLLRSGQSGKRIVALQHVPVHVEREGECQLTLESLGSYIELIDEDFGPHLTRGGLRVLVAIPVVTASAADLRAALLDRRLYHAELLLPRPLGSVDMEDIEDCLRGSARRRIKEAAVRLAAAIHAQTKGIFVDTQVALRQVDRYLR